jgi:hypothetical protein
MPERSKKSSGLHRLVYSSPWLLLIFIGLFALCIYAEYARLPVPRYIPSPRRLILFSNFCFLLVIALRFVNLLSRFSREQRYDAGDRPLTDAHLCAAPLETLRAEFAAAGFRLDKNGYGEKRTLSLPATTIIYGGMLLALLVGTYDNMRSFSAVFFQGEGAPSPLDDAVLYFNVSKGPLASVKNMPRFQVRKLIYANAQWPKGAVEIALSDKDNHAVAQGIVAKDGKPLVYRGLEYHLGRFLADVPLLIATDNMHLEFEDTLKVQPLDPPQGNYTYYASFKGKRLLWDILYDPAGKAIRFLGGKNGKNVVDGVYIFGRDTAVQMGPFIAKVPFLTEWAEIHVVRPRHMLLVYVGLGITIIGMLMRLVFRPVRVWLEGAPEGCRVWAVGGEAKKLLSTLDSRQGS